MYLNLTFKTFSRETLAIGARIALEYKMFVTGWGLGNDLKRMCDPDDEEDRKYCERIFVLTIAYWGNTPVGVGLRRWFDGYTMVYVPKHFRRLHIGTAVVNALPKTHKVFSNKGCPASIPFWKSVKIYCSDGWRK